MITKAELARAKKIQDDFDLREQKEKEQKYLKRKRNKAFWVTLLKG